MRKKIILGIGVLLGALMIYRIGSLLFSGSNKRPFSSARPPVAIEVDQVRFEPIREVRQLTGSVYPQYQYVVAPKVSGRLVSIDKRIGDWVESNEIVAQIDDAEYQQGVLESDANLKIANATLMEAEIQFKLAAQEKKRVESLQAKGISSPSELDTAVSNYSAQESRLQLARAQVEQREAALRSAKIRLGYTRLTASEPGFVGERFVDVGALLAPNAPVISIIGIRSVIVRATIVERDYGFIKIGQSAEVTVDAFPERKFYGNVSRIAPMLQETSRVAQMEVDVSNEGLLLKPGMFARVAVVTAEKDSAQTVPTVAVVLQEKENGVFMVADGEKVARYFSVETGIVTPERTEIVSPRLSGRVVTLGQHLLNDGSPVILADEAGQNRDRRSNQGNMKEKHP